MKSTKYIGKCSNHTSSTEIKTSGSEPDVMMLSITVERNRKDTLFNDFLHFLSCSIAQRKI